MKKKISTAVKLSPFSKIKERNYHAQLVIYDAGEMDWWERQWLAEWLHKEAYALTVDGDDYGPRFMARYVK